jgi:hypothetical protein
VEHLEPRLVLSSFFVAPTGSDGNAGTLEAPFATIGRGMDAAQPGDSVLLRGGTYRETISSVRSGLPGQPITIESYHGEPVFISASDVVDGPWTETSPGSGIYSAPVTGSLPASFWTSFATQPAGAQIVERDGSLRVTVVNDGSYLTAATRSASASSEWNFFAEPITWRIRGLSIDSTGTTAMPLDKAAARFSIMTSTGSGYSSDDSVNVEFSGNGNLRLRLKKDTANSWGTSMGAVTDAAITGFDLALGPGDAGNVAYSLTAYPTGQAVASGQWAMAQADWSDGGDGSKSYVQVFAQEGVYPATDPTQQFELAVGSYEILAGSETVLRDEFADGDPTTADYFPSGRSSGISSGYDQVFVDGQMQNEARFANKVSADLLSPDTVGLTMNNSYGLSGAAFAGKPDGFFAGARFLGRVGQGWAWQTAIVTSSAGSTVQLDPASASTWWWPNYANQSSNAGIGYLYGKLEFLDADREWHLQRSVDGLDTLYVRLDGGADPTDRVVEHKVRNWTVNINGHDNIVVSGLNLRGGAVRLNGSGLVLEDCDARYLSHYLTFSQGSAVNGGLAQGGGVVVSGSNNVVRRCSIYETAGSGIVASGTSHLLTRNSVHDVDYSGTYATGINLSGTGHTATFNTIHDAGRDILRPGGSGLTVMYNDLSRAGRMALDLGLVYTYGTNGEDADGNRSRIAYNWLHENGNPADPISKGIYLDNYCRNFIVDHNVIWNIGQAISTQSGIKLNSPTIGNLVYHNTLIGAPAYNLTTWTHFPDSNPDATFWTTDNHGMDYTAQNNLLIAAGGDVDAILENYAGRDFRPKSGSAAVDPTAATGLVAWVTTDGVTNVPASFKLSMRYKNQRFAYREVTGQGVVLPGINDGFSGATPDSGAYELGGAYWTAGVDGFAAIDLDADGNGTADALTDGILSLRYLFDPNGTWNYSDALGSGATRTTRADIQSFLDDAQTAVLDVDGNGAADALTDGILILRYLFDPAGAWNYSDALGGGATRTTREELKAYLDQWNPGLTAATAGEAVDSTSPAANGGAAGSTAPAELAVPENPSPPADAAAGAGVRAAEFDEAPVLAAVETTALAYAENAASKPITAAITVADADNTNLAGATIQITGNYQNGQDVLSFTDTATITATWTAATGTITLSGSDTLANYQAALRAVKYRNTSDSPDTAARTVTFLVNDGSADSNLLTRSINVTAVNDAPSGTDATRTIAEDATYTFAASDFGFSDPLDSPANRLAAVKITTLPAAGSLTLDGMAVTTGQYVGVAEIDAGRLAFTPAANANGAGCASFTFQVQDDGGASSLVPFSVVVLPDSQSHVAQSGWCDTQVQWICDNIASENVAFVTHEGDLTNLNSAAEWAVAAESMYRLDGLVPWGAVPGNHDGSQLFLDNFGPQHFAGQSWYGGSYSTSSYQYFQAGGRTYLSLEIAYLAPSDAIAWAQQVLNDNPGIPTIVTTHEYISANGARTTYGTTLWNSLIKTNSQIFMVLCGHWLNQGNLAHNVVYNDSGESVFEVIANYQDLSNYDGLWLRLMQFDEANNAIHVNTYSPLYQDDWQGVFGTQNLAKNQFDLTMDFADRLGPVNEQSRLDLDPTPHAISFNVTAVNDAPRLAAIEDTALAYLENDPPAALTDTITVTDPDSTTLAGATVQITTGYQNGQDLLSFVDTASITGSWDAVAATMTLSGADTLANYQAALRAVKYRNTSANPSTVVRTVTFTANDGHADNNLSAPVTRQVAVQGGCNIDADGNNAADALTDGILILRYLFDPAGPWNYSDALGSNSTRTTREAIKTFLDDGRNTTLDVDGNGTADALTDGILILRYLFDPAGPWNYSDALGGNATRTTRAQIKAFLDQQNPSVATASVGSGDDVAADLDTLDAVLEQWSPTADSQIPLGRQPVADETDVADLPGELSSYQDLQGRPKNGAQCGQPRPQKQAINRNSSAGYSP